MEIKTKTHSQMGDKLLNSELGSMIIYEADYLGLNMVIHLSRPSSSTTQKRPTTVVASFSLYCFVCACVCGFVAVSLSLVAFFIVPMQ